MKRTTMIGNRLIGVLLALLLLAFAAACVNWWGGYAFDWPAHLSASWSRNLEAQSYFPWALAAGGVVFCLVGIRLFIAQLRSTGTSELRVPSTEQGTTLQFDLDAALDAASDALVEVLGVQSAHGSSCHEGGELVCSFAVKIDPQADLQLVASDCERVLGELRSCVGRPELACRVIVTTAAYKTSLARVS